LSHILEGRFKCFLGDLKHNFITEGEQNMGEYLKNKGGETSEPTKERIV